MDALSNPHCLFVCLARFTFGVAAALIPLCVSSNALAGQQDFLPKLSERVDLDSDESLRCEKLEKCLGILHGCFQRHLPTESGHLVFKPYRGRIQEQKMPVAGLPLVQVVLEHDGTTRLLELLEQRRLSLAAENNSSAITFRSPFLLTDKSQSDAVLVVRNNQLLVLPRPMMAHPLVGLSRIKPLDAVFTFNSREEISAGDTIDKLIQQALFDSKKNTDSGSTQGEPRVIIDAVFDRSRLTSAESLLAVVRNNATLDYKTVSSMRNKTLDPLNLASPLDSIYELLIDPSAEKGLSQPVLLIVRQRGLHTLTYVVPFPDAGPLGMGGPLFQNLIEVPTDSAVADEVIEDVWLQGAFVGFQQLALDQNDLVVLTRLERIPFFQPSLR